MSVVKIRNTSVSFPYETPYEIQIDYMKKVIDCLEDKKHGVLESPTGTGKTLCLLAPITSWLRTKKFKEEAADPGMSFGKKRDRVWYTSRTHAQIAQTVAEARRCDIDGLSVRVMGARDQLCVHPEVTKEKESYVKSAMCKELVKTRSCRFHRELDYEKHSPAFYRNGEILDIEDLVSAGRTIGICPYYMAKQAKDHADIVMLPYNYVIDRDSRDLGIVPFFNNIVVFDEGHNVPQTCEEGFEFSMTSADIAQGISRTQELMNSLIRMRDGGATDDDDVDWARHAQSSMDFIGVLKGLEDSFENKKTSDLLYPLNELLTFMEKAGINHQTSKNLLSAIEGFKADSVRLALSKEILSTFHLMERMLHVLFGSTTLSFAPDVVERSFKFVVEKDSNHVNNSKRLALFCFNPSFGIQDVLLQSIETMIITSGTLSPLPSFIHELSLPNPITLENGHIASPAQVPFMILGTGVNNVKMDASFQNRKNSAYIYSLGMTLTNLISSVPDGVLLLFSSYSMMQGLKDHWETECGVWNRLNSLKRVFIEPRGKEEFINCMENYRRAIDSGNGAILMGVLRGKISEGMDFKDQYCRSVFVIGVPFPPVKDLRVQGKTKYAESLTIVNAESLKSEKLYNSYLSVEAMKATNQAIGRVIRHGQDYGAIILVDYRFAWPRLFTNISKWLRGSTPSEVNFMTAKKGIREFFKNVTSGKLGIPEVRCQRIAANGDPVAGNIDFEVYDHKTSYRQRAAAMRISTASGLDTKRNAGVCYYEDSAEDNCDVMARYQKTPLKTEEPALTKANSSSMFETMNTASPSSRIEFRKIDLSTVLQKSPSEKRKIEDSCSELGESSRKVCRKIKSNVMSYYHKDESQLSANPNKNSVKTTPEIKADRRTNLINYFEKAKRLLPPNDAVQFKEVSCSYMKGDIFLPAVVSILRQIFRTSVTLPLLNEFEICVKSEHLPQWKQLMEP